MLQYLPYVKQSAFFSDISDDILTEGLSKCNVKFLKAKNVVFSTESDDTNIYFIAKGALRGYTERNGKEINTSFFIQGQMFANLQALYFNKRSYVTFETVVPTTLLYLSKQRFFEMLTKYPRMNVFSMKIVAQAVISYEERLLLLLGFDAKERYIRFMKKFGEFSNFLHQKDIASYLSVTPETLSRVRKELAERKEDPIS